MEDKVQNTDNQNQPSLQAKKKVNKKAKIGSKWVIDRGEVLGQGQLAVVYGGFNQENKSKKVAIKEQDLSYVKNILGEQSQEYLKREVEVMLKVKSDFIVEILDVKQTEKNNSTTLFIIMEKLEGGTLQQKIQKYTKLPEKSAIQYFRQIMEGYKVIADQKVIHRDLKPANIIFETENNCKIADFGLAKLLNKNDLGVQQITNRGTPHYKCPELLTYDEYIHVEYPQKIDIWSLGVIFYEMLVGKIPWNPNIQDLQEFSSQIRSNPVSFPKEYEISSLTQDIIKNMLNIDAKLRFSYQDCLNHEFFKQQ